MNMSDEQRLLAGGSMLVGMAAPVSRLGALAEARGTVGRLSSQINSWEDLGVPNLLPNPIRPPVPRVNVADDFIMRTTPNGSVTLKFGNPEGVHGLIVDVDQQGVLGFNIRSPAGGSSFSDASGTDMFASAMQRLNQEGIQVNSIRGTWIEGTDSVNAAEYLTNIDRGMSPQRAAANTWTGRMAEEYGFTNVGVPKTGHTITTVIFGR